MNGTSVYIMDKLAAKRGTLKPAFYRKSRETEGCN
jgi:hypothetical protein